MNILHVIVGLNVGGAEMMLKRLVASHSEASSYRHTVVSLTNMGSIGPEIQACGVKVYSLNMRTIFGIPLVLWRLVRLINETCPDIVQTWMYHADLIGGLAARLAGSCRVVWGIRSTAIPQGALSFTYWLVRLCAISSYFIPDRIICCANSAKEAHIKLRYAPHKMTVIPNGYNFSIFDRHLSSRGKARMELGFDVDDMVIGTIGRFDPLKDFHNFVAAAAKLSAKRPNIKYLMVGRNIEWSNSTLRGWIESDGLANNFKLMGAQSDVPYFLSAMDVFCLSSLNEAFPNVVVEAMAMGLPCVVTRAGDAAEILGDDDFAVPVRDSVSLSDALLKMCNLDQDERRKLGEQGAKKVRAEYGIEYIRKKYEAAYDEVTRE
jgi:glycosyltransferase involved in cell wall biosynthesis